MPAAVKFGGGFVIEPNINGDYGRHEDEQDTIPQGKVIWELHWAAEMNEHTDLEELFSEEKKVWRKE